MDIDKIAERIARALPATIDGRTHASPDQHAMHGIYGWLNRVHPDWTSSEAAHEARKRWIHSVLAEASR